MKFCVWLLLFHGVAGETDSIAIDLENNKTSSERIAQRSADCADITTQGPKSFYFELMDEDEKVPYAVELVRDIANPKLIVYWNYRWDISVMFTSDDMVVQEKDVEFKPIPQGMRDRPIEIPIYSIEYAKQVRLRTYQAKDYAVPDGLEISVDAPKGTKECWAPSCIVIQRFVLGNYWSRARVAASMNKEGSSRKVGRATYDTTLVPAIGVSSGGGLLSGSKLFGSKRFPYTASEALFDKLRCLSNEYLDQEERLFKCKDRAGNDVLVPWKLAERVGFDCNGF
jgi:hypothetical protein